MSLSAAVLDALAASGVSREQIIAAMKADIAERAAAEASRLEAQKEGNRERQRRKRERDNAVSRDVTDVTRDARDPSPNERDNLTPTRERKTEPKGSSKSLVEEEKRQPTVSCIRRAYPPPEGVTDEQWMAFRTQRKKPLNERSYTLVCNKLTELAEAGWPPGDMIDRAIEHGWETVFKPRNFGNERDSNPLATAVQRLAAHQ